METLEKVLVIQSTSAPAVPDARGSPGEIPSKTALLYPQHANLFT